MKAWVIFDLDGTLIESEEIWRDVRREFVAEHGGRWRDDAQTAMMGMRTDEWAQYMHDELGVRLPANAIRDQVVAGIVECLSESVPALPGAGAVLERLASAFTLGLATSSPRAVADSVLAKTGWTKYFQVVVSSESLARGKPFPDVYLRALGLLDADALRTAAIEDSSNGIRSARAAGCAVVAVPNRSFPPDPEALALAAWVVDSLDAIDTAGILRLVSDR